MLIARSALRFGDGYLMPGDVVPKEPGRDFGPWLEAGLIEEVPDLPQEPAPPPAPEPEAAAKASHSTAESTPEPDAPSEAEARPFVCDECGQRFTSESRLRFHKGRVHWRP